jgi:cytochrome c
MGLLDLGLATLVTSMLALFISVPVHAQVAGAPGSVIGSQLGVDAIQEFSVQARDYSAEYRPSAGAVIDAISKSSTNEFHGSANWSLRDEHFTALAMAATMFAQNPPTTKAPSKKSASSGSAARGKELFENKCGVCHNAESDVKKIGPGLKGISKRGTFTTNSNKVSDQSLKTLIENGGTQMPPFRDGLDTDQMKDVIAYVKTL